MQAPGRLVIVLTLALLVLIWGTTWAAIAISLRGIPPVTGVALRFAVAALVLLGVSRAMGLSFGRSRRELWLIVAHALLSFCISYGVVFWAEQWLPSGLTAVIFATMPLMIALMAHFSLPGERLTISSLAGTLLGFAGIAVIFSEDLSLLGGRSVTLAATVLLLSPLASAISNILFKRWGQGIHPVPFNAAAMGLASLAMGLMALLVERQRSLVFDLPSVSALLYMAVMGSALTFSLYFWLLKHLQARQVSLVAYASPVVAVLVGVLLLGEPMTSHTIIGSVMVVLGVALATR